jgi:hypothetical protein
MSIPILLDEKPIVVPGGSAGEWSEGDDRQARR